MSFLLLMQNESFIDGSDDSIADIFGDVGT